MNDEKDKISFAQFHQEYVTSYIQLADAKAGVCFALIGAIMGYLITKVEFQLALSVWCTFAGLASWVTIFALISAATLSFLVIVPRFHHSNPGPVFYQSVAAHPDAASYIGSIRALDDAGLADAHLTQSYDLSCVCNEKYRVLGIAMWAGVIAVALSGICLAIVAL